MADPSKKYTIVLPENDWSKYYSWNGLGSIKNGVGEAWDKVQSAVVEPAPASSASTPELPSAKYPTPQLTQTSQPATEGSGVWGSIKNGVGEAWDKVQSAFGGGGVGDGEFSLNRFDGDNGVVFGNFNTGETTLWYNGEKMNATQIENAIKNGTLDPKVVERAQHEAANKFAQANAESKAAWDKGLAGVGMGLGIFNAWQAYKGYKLQKEAMAEQRKNNERNYQAMRTQGNNNIALQKGVLLGRAGRVGASSSATADNLREIQG